MDEIDRDTWLFLTIKKEIHRKATYPLNKERTKENKQRRDTRLKHVRCSLRNRTKMVIRTIDSSSMLARRSLNY
jgi:hypothetical protein